MPFEGFVEDRQIHGPHSFDVCPSCFYHASFVFLLSPPCFDPDLGRCSFWSFWRRWYAGRKFSQTGDPYQSSQKPLAWPGTHWTHSGLPTNPADGCSLFFFNLGVVPFFQESDPPKNKKNNNAFVCVCPLGFP